jgi:hypothetical protein
MHRWLAWNVFFPPQERLKEHPTYKILREMEAVDRLIAADAIRTAPDQAKLPLTTKADIRQHRASLRSTAVGMVLQLTIIEDLFAYNTPKVFDLYGVWKEAPSTDSDLENKAMLFGPGLYTRFVQEGHHACQAISRGGATGLNRMQLKTRIRRMIRALSTSHGATQDTTEPTRNE